jgi:integrase
MGQVISLRARVVEPVEEQEPKQEKKRRLKGQGSVYLRGNTYWIQYRADGKVYNESAKTDKKMEAIGYLKKKVGEIALGHRPSRDFSKTTFEELKEIYFTNFDRKQKKDKERAELAIKHLEEIFKGYRVINITEKLIEEYAKGRLKEEVSRATVNRELSVLRAMLRLGVRHKLVSLDRMPTIEMYAPSDPRQGFIEREQYQKLLDALPEWLKPVLTFAFQTAWRKEEILGLKWAHIDMTERQITLPSRMSKNGKARPIYADDVVYTVLKEQNQKQFQDGIEGFPFVFYRMRSTGGSRSERKENRKPERIGDFKKVWAKACEKAGLEGLLFHDLRRSAIREMVRNGYSESVAMQISGHSTRAVFDRYNIVSLDDQKAAAKRRIERINYR